MSVRDLIAFMLVAGCELQPAPKQQPAPPPPPAAEAPTPAPAPPPPADAAVVAAPGDAAAVADAQAAPDVSPECTQTAMHVADVVIAGAEPAQKGIFERERTNIVKTTQDACTSQAWTRTLLRCLDAAQTKQALDDCHKKFPQPAAHPADKAAPAPAPPPGRGSGGKRAEPTKR